MTEEQKPDDLRTIIAHPFFALGRQFCWSDAELEVARVLIDITVIRIEEHWSRVPPDTAAVLRRAEAAEDSEQALIEILEREGYRRCDIPACNCGSWHKS